MRGKTRGGGGHGRIGVTLLPRGFPCKARCFKMAATAVVWGSDDSEVRWWASLYFVQPTEGNRVPGDCCWKFDTANLGWQTTICVHSCGWQPLPFCQSFLIDTAWGSKLPWGVLLLCHSYLWWVNSWREAESVVCCAEVMHLDHIWAH